MSARPLDSRTASGAASERLASTVSAARRAARGGVFAAALMLAAGCAGGSGDEADRGAGWDGALVPGQTLEIKGQFQGMDPRPCSFAATTRPNARNRSDWLIRSSGRCMWVSEGQKIFGDPGRILEAASVGRSVELTAKVGADDARRLYLIYVSGRAPN